MRRLVAILRLWLGPTRPLGCLTRLDGSVGRADEIARRYGRVFDPRRWGRERRGPDLSSGMASNDEVDAAPEVETLRRSGGETEEVDAR